MTGDANQAGRIRIALAELKAGGDMWCYRHWFPGRSRASLERELRALDAREDAESLRIRVRDRAVRRL